MIRPEIIIYRDSIGDISVSLDGGKTTAFLTENGLTIPIRYAEYQESMYDPYCHPMDDECEVWRSGPDA
jgi:hypothetical protein